MEETFWSTNPWHTAWERSGRFTHSKREGFDAGAISEPRVEEMASYYLKELRTVQPRGPHYLVGADEYLGWKQVLYGKLDVCEAPGHEEALFSRETRGMAD